MLQLELLLNVFELQDRRGEMQGLYECVLFSVNFMSSGRQFKVVYRDIFVVRAG